MADCSQSIMLCGIPASGKSTYGDWLQQEKGMLFVDVEEDGALEGANLETQWSRLFNEPSCARDFVAGLADRTVLAWGFPVRCLPMLAALKEAGLVLWWLDGNRKAARDSFIVRGTVGLKYFDRQMLDIETE